MPALTGQIDRDDVAHLLSALVQLPSVNPPGDALPVAELIQARLHALGLVTRIVESAPCTAAPRSTWRPFARGGGLCAAGRGCAGMTRRPIITSIQGDPV